ncbi:kinase-like domain-containing protein [Exophiala viscosa]|uniref:Kinase-like domain-containing protein n=1 Tax=Exophiala viscosa TaxID=2486360 RepID=A0AAN6DTH9_9EURO|nr:kinase-like domain-containing protein [Exophiala viscosa]
MSDDLTFCGKGYHSTVYRLHGTDTVVKCFEGASAEAQCNIETKVYERFTSVSEAPPSSILKHYGQHSNIPNSIILEHAGQGSLWEWLWRAREFGQLPTPPILYRWARQAAEALAFAHRCGIFHSDIHVINFLLDGDSNLKVADWAGASINGGHSLSRYRRDHTLPGTTGDNISVASEIFAFGMALYNMITIEEPYPGLHHEHDKDELKRRLAKKEFPDATKLVVLGQVIRGCWNLQYSSMEEVLESIVGNSNAFSRTIL